MMNLFKKLDRMAERLISTMDGELNEPVVRAVTGDVFTHGMENRRPAVSPAVTQNRANEAQRVAHQLCDAVTDTLHPPLSLPAMPNASISTQVT
jgi:hypothetical protein